MQLSSDRLGFPLIDLRKRGLLVSLLPLPKVQVESWLAEPEGPGDEWYAKILEVNPRASWRDFTADQRENLFVTGLLASEALSIARWMGPGGDLLTVEEWRDLDKFLLSQRLDASELSQCSMPEAARAIVQRLLEQSHPGTWGALTLLRGGIMEWVRDGNGAYVGIGSPRPQFQRNVWNPQLDLQPLPAEERHRLFGARIIFRTGRPEGRRWGK